MKIALVIGQKKEGGGGFIYELNMVRALINEKRSGNIYAVVTSRKKNIVPLKKQGIPAELFRVSIKVRIEIFLRQNCSLFKYPFKSFPLLRITSFDSFLKKKSIDLAYFLSPNPLAFLLDRCNYISTVWDLCHRDHPEFSEVRENVEFENRENLFRKTLPKSIAVIVDSDHGGDNVAKRYQVDENRIVTIPFFINEDDRQLNCDIKEKYGIRGDFVFYPAQFWAHKNHVYILDSLYELKKTYNKKIYAIFPGTDMGNLSYVKDYAAKLQIDDQVTFPGFLPRNEIVACYKQALALVYPTYFGPTNFPPLEALYFNCIVIHADTKGAASQTEDAALHFNLDDPHSLTEIINTVSDYPRAFDYLKVRGKKILERHSKEKAVEKIEKIVAGYAIKMKTWKMPLPNVLII